MGEHDISSTTDGVIREIKVIRSAPHLFYNQLEGTNDIAILYLEQDVDISRELLKLRLLIVHFCKLKNIQIYHHCFFHFEQYASDQFVCL